MPLLDLHYNSTLINGSLLPLLFMPGISSYLDMIGTQDYPSTEAIAQVDHCHTATEADDIGKGNPHGNNENLEDMKKRQSEIRFWNL